MSVVVYQEIKSSALRAKPMDDVAETEQEAAVAALNNIKKTLISQAISDFFTLYCRPYCYICIFTTV